MENPNPYDDDAFTRASVEADGVIGALWEAGARVEDIEAVVENAITNAGGPDTTVSIFAKS